MDEETKFDLEEQEKFEQRIREAILMFDSCANEIDMSNTHDECMKLKMDEMGPVDEIEDKYFVMAYMNMLQNPEYKI